MCASGKAWQFVGLTTATTTTTTINIAVPVVVRWAGAAGGGVASMVKAMCCYEVAVWCVGVMAGMAVVAVLDFILVAGEVCVEAIMKVVVG